MNWDSRPALEAVTRSYACTFHPRARFDWYTGDPLLDGWELRCWIGNDRDEPYRGMPVGRATLSAEELRCYAHLEPYELVQRVVRAMRLAHRLAGGEPHRRFRFQLRNPKHLAEVQSDHT